MMEAKKAIKNDRAVIINDASGKIVNFGCAIIKQYVHAVKRQK